MYGKLTMLAVAGVMALSGCGNSGGDTGTAAESKGETTALAGTETEKALEEASQGEKEPSIGRTDIISANTSDIRSMDPQVGVDSPSATLNRHIYNGLVKIDENREVSVIRKFRITAPDGKSYNTNHYSLEMIIAVGFKVNSERAVQFRKWVNQIAKL